MNVSVSYRKKGNKWHIRFRAKGRKEIIKSLAGRLAEKTVAGKAAWYEEECHLGRFDPWAERLEQSRLTIGDAVDEYCAGQFASSNWAESTYKRGLSDLHAALAPLTDRKAGAGLNGRDFQSAFDQCPGNAATRKGRRGRVNAFLRWAAEEGLLADRYRVDISMDDVIEIRNTDKIKYLTWNQLRDVCAAHRWLAGQNAALYGGDDHRDPDFYPDLWWFMFYLMLRKSEPAKIVVKDLLPGDRIRIHGKGRRTDIIHMPPPAREIAEKYSEGKGPDDPLFLSDMNRPRHHLRKAIGLALGSEAPTGFHQLRHGGVVHYLTLGKPVQFVSKLARHRSVQVTLVVYGDIIPDGLEQAFSDVEHQAAVKNMRLVKKASG
jgi:integrase